MDKETRLIVGLGNPGSRYENTLHNIGFLVLEAFAVKYQVTFKKEKSFLGSLAVKEVESGVIRFLKPETYMNLSGDSVRKVASYWKVVPENVLVVCDDVYLPFGAFRFRKQGGAGGHNGLKSVQTALMTQAYPRLRVGVGEPKQMPLEDYVLSSFGREENKQLPQILEDAADLLNLWVEKEEKALFQEIEKRNDLRQSLNQQQEEL